MEPEEIDALVENYLKEKGLPLSPALTFDDVNIRERISDISSRRDITDLRTRLAKDFYLNIPIVSANMDTVTDSRMAIALARLGGLGFIHQFMSLEKRVEEVKKVKRADSLIVENPAKVEPDCDLGTAEALMRQLQISCLLVVDGCGKLVGILTSRDILFHTDPNIQVGSLMTRQPLVTAPTNITHEEAQRILEKRKIEKLPIVDKNGKPVGLITTKDILKRRQFPNAVRDEKGRLAIGATLRLNNDYLGEARQLVAAGTDVLLLDTARAAAIRVAEAVGRLKQAFPDSILVVGDTALPDAVVLLARMGADCIKIGVGPGAACKTQEETGVGAPQLYAIATCVAVAKKLGVGIIGDGGIRNSGCLAKALVAGADAVMIGSLFAGTDESPGELFPDGHILYKIYRGSASLSHQLERLESGDLDEVRKPEGESGKIPYAGPLNAVIGDLLNGLRSSMSYVGVHNLEEFWQFGKFLWRTKAGQEEGKPRI